MSLLLATLSGGPTIVETEGSSSGVAAVNGIACYQARVDGGSSGVATVTGVACYYAFTEGTSSGTCVVDGQMEDAGTPPIVVEQPRFAGPGGGGVFSSGEFWTEEQDEDEIMAVVQAWLTIK